MAGYLESDVIVSHLCLNADPVAAQDDGIHMGKVSRAYVASWSLVALIQYFPHFCCDPTTEDLRWTSVLWLPSF